MLELNAVNSGYGETQVLNGMSITAREGRLLAVPGRNGAGTSTTLKTNMGLLPVWSGAITLAGKPMARCPHDIARWGIACAAETRDIFASLPVRENLKLAAGRLGGAGADWTLA